MPGSGVQFWLLHFIHTTTYARRLSLNYTPPWPPHPHYKVYARRLSLSTTHLGLRIRGIVIQDRVHAINEDVLLKADPVRQPQRQDHCPGDRPLQ